MPNTDPPIIDLDTLGRYTGIIVRAEEKLGIRCQQYVYFGATDENLTECIQALNMPGVVGIKVYPKSRSGKIVTTGTIGVAEDLTIRKLLDLSEASGKPVAFHCDDPEIIASEGNTIRAEATYVEKILMMARDFSCAKIVVCHVSCRESAELVLRAQDKGMWVALEICPHYLWFDSDGTNWNQSLDPVFYKCFNSLRPKENRKFLVNLLRMENPLIFIGSDNAPHTWKEKLKKKIGGLPSNQEMVPVLLTLAKRFGWDVNSERIYNLLFGNASRFFKIGAIGKLHRYNLEKRVCDSLYNNGVVENPWKGSELYYPVPVER